MQKPYWTAAIILFVSTILHAPTTHAAEPAAEPGEQRTTTIIKQSSKRDDVQEGKSCKTITSYELLRTEEFQCTAWTPLDGCVSTDSTSPSCPQSCSSGQWVVVAEKRGATIKKERVDCHILVE